MEKDIEILEELKYELTMRNKQIEDAINENGVLMSFYEEREEQIQAIQNVLSGLKQLKEENKKMAEQYLTNNPGVTRYLNENYIFKSKVKELLKESEKEYKRVLNSMERRISHTRDKHKIRSYYADFGVKKGRVEMCRYILGEE